MFLKCKGLIKSILEIESTKTTEIKQAYEERNSNEKIREEF